MAATIETVTLGTAKTVAAPTATSVYKLTEITITSPYETKVIDTTQYADMKFEKREGIKDQIRFSLNKTIKAITQPDVWSILYNVMLDVIVNTNGDVIVSETVVCKNTRPLEIDKTKLTAFADTVKKVEQAKVTSIKFSVE